MIKMLFFRCDGGIEDAIETLKRRGLALVERLGRRGNRDEWLIVQDFKFQQALVSLMTDDNQTVICVERLVDPQGRLF